MHKLLALPSPLQVFSKMYRNKIVNFLWDGKTPRIAYHKLIRDYDQLGLKLIDLETKNIALKAAWIPKWFHKKDTDWIYCTLPVKNNKIWLCNIKPSDVRKLVGIDFDTCDVAGSIWYAWAEYTYKYPESTEEVLDSLLWGNSLIVRKGFLFLISDC